MFKLDGPIVSALNKLTDVILLNLIVLVMSVPIITIGAAWTAMYYVTVKMVKDEESYIFKDFFKSFRQNFVQSTVIWIINLIIAFLFVIDARILSGSVETVSKTTSVLIVLMALFLFAFITNVYPMQSHYHNTVFGTIKNALMLSIARLPYTVLYTVLTLFPFLLLFTRVGGYLSPIVILVGFSGPAYICSKFWRKVFARLDPEEVVESADGTGEEELNTTEYES